MGVQLLTLQFGCTLPDKVRQILNIITSSNTKATHKVPSSILQVAVGVVGNREVIFGPAEIRITRNGSGTVELAKTIPCLRLRVGIESLPSEELVRGNALLGTESGLGLGEFRIWIELIKRAV